MLFVLTVFPWIPNSSFHLMLSILPCFMAVRVTHCHTEGGILYSHRLCNNRSLERVAQWLLREVPEAEVVPCDEESLDDSKMWAE